MAPPSSWNFRAIHCHGMAYWWPKSFGGVLPSSHAEIPCPDNLQMSSPNLWHFHTLSQVMKFLSSPGHVPDSTGIHHLLDHKAVPFAGWNRPLSADYFLQLYFFVKTLFTVFKMTFDKKLNQHQLISNLLDIDVGAALACIVKVILWILAFGVG